MTKHRIKKEKVIVKEWYSFFEGGFPLSNSLSPEEIMENICGINTELLEETLSSFNDERKSVLEGKNAFGYRKEGNKIVEDGEEQNAISKIKEIKNSKKNISLNGLWRLFGGKIITVKKNTFFFQYFH